MTQLFDFFSRLLLFIFLQKRRQEKDKRGKCKMTTWLRHRSPESKSSPRNGSYGFIESSALVECSEQGGTKAREGRIKDGKRFLLTLAVVSVVLNKAVLVQEFLNFDTISTYVWLPSLFALDLLFLSVLYCGLTIQCSRWPIFSYFVWIPCVLAVLLTAVVVALEVTCVIGHRSRIPWNLVVIRMG